jgi:hypothetical protein
MIWMKAQERVATLRSCILFLQSPCNGPCLLQIFFFWSSFILPPDKLERPPRIQPIAGEITYDGKSSIHQQLSKSSIMPYFPVTTRREDKSLFSR